MSAQNDEQVGGLNGSVLREDDDGYVVRVNDRNDVEHRILINYDGEILDHASDALAGVDFDELSDEERSVVEQIHNFARHQVQQETTEDVVPLAWRPEFLADCIDVFRECSEEQFGAFEQYYQALQDPPIDVSNGRVFVVYQPVRLTEEFDAIKEGGPLRYLVETNRGEYEWRGPDAPHHIAFHQPLYTFEWPFGERFREFLVHHLKCQVRDAYVNRGETPPEAYRVDGFGKINFAGEHLTDSGK